MAKDGLLIDAGDLNEPGYKVHWVNGVPIQCSASGADSDCQFCRMEKRNKIKTWLKKIPFPTDDMLEVKKFLKGGIQKWALGKTHEEICKLCRLEKTPCFKCLRKNCEDWGVVDHADGIQIVHGCTTHNEFEGYCTDFECKFTPRLVEPNPDWRKK